MKCKYCSQEYSSSSELIEHANLQHKDEISTAWKECYDCKVFVPSEADLRRHIFLVHKSEKFRKMTCQFCGQKFSKSALLINHCNEDHLDTISKGHWLQCCTCKRFLPDLAAIRKHQAAAHGSPTKFDKRCDFCRKTCKNEIHFRIHANTVHRRIVSETWHKCFECRVYFPSTSGLANHQTRTGHSNEKLEELVQVNVHRCEFCSDSFDDLKSYLRHANKQHKDDVSKKWILCISCQLHFDSNRAYRHHLCGKDRLVARSCSFCVPDKIFDSKDDFYQHIKIDHPDKINKDDWQKCAKCQFFFPSKNSLISHVKRVHKKELKTSPDSAKVQNLQTKKSRKCKFCSERFVTSSSYIKHNNEKHLKSLTKWFALCEMCDLRFPSQKCRDKHHCEKL